MNWLPLDDMAQLNIILEKSFDKPQVIFKHSTRCSVSKMVKNRLEKEDPPANADFYYLDLIQFRNISNAIAEQFRVRHESPQIIIVKNGKEVYNEDHSSIHMQDIADQVSEV